MKNDITYEYRVFTNRLIDVESMEVGICTSKVINELKPKNKVDGRFFHTSDTDEWFFCWNGELQKLNLKGDSDVSAALAEVEKLISDAKVAVEDAKKTAGEAKGATALQTIPSEYVTETELNAKNYATTSQVNAKQDVISDLETIRSGASKGATALQSIPSEYVTETELNGKGYLTSHQSIKTINGTSLVGSGDVKVGYKTLQTSTSSSMTLTPNVYHRNTNTSLSTLTISLGSVTDSTILNEYFVEFTTRSAGTTVSLPSTIKWVNGENPTFEAGCTYQVSVVNNLGVVTKFK